MIHVTDRISIDEREIEESFVRSSGPGGQNVNKLSTAVQLRFDVRHSPSLPNDVSARLQRLAGSRLTRDGVLVIIAQSHRTQGRNRQDALDRLLDLIQKEIRRLAEDGPTAQELAKAKAYLNSSFALNLDTSSKIASLLVQLQRDDLGIDYIARRPAMIESVTLDDARRVAKRLLNGGLLVTVVGKPEGVASTTPTAN